MLVVKFPANLSPTTTEMMWSGRSNLLLDIVYEKELRKKLIIGSSIAAAKIFYLNKYIHYTLIERKTLN